MNIFAKAFEIAKSILNRKTTKAMLITPEQLDKVTDTLLPSRCKVMADFLNELCEKYGITDRIAFRMFTANCLQESGEFAHKEENMYYSASRLMIVWPSRFPTLASTEGYAKNPQALSNRTYGGRMGNTEPNDGYEFRGGAFIGITGRELYTKYAAYIGKPLEETANLVRTDDRYALDASCWFFAIYKKLIPVALTGNFKAVCSLINTGSTKKTAIGMDVRQKYFLKSLNSLYIFIQFSSVFQNIPFNITWIGKQRFVWVSAITTMQVFPSCTITPIVARTILY